jgi:hypothetical protein
MSSSGKDSVVDGRSRVLVREAKGTKVSFARCLMEGVQQERRLHSRLLVLRRDEVQPAG